MMTGSQAPDGGEATVRCEHDYVVVFINTLDNKYYRSFRTANSPQAAIISAQKERNEDYEFVHVLKLSGDNSPQP